VLATIQRDNIEAAGKTWTAEEEAAFKQPTLDKYETEGHAYYSSARLWDDGIIDPASTRDILGLSFSIAMKNKVPDTKFGVFRM
jgi:3-methylcrotonyl-CoA carboxylase beta subunit